MCAGGTRCSSLGTCRDSASSAAKWTHHGENRIGVYKHASILSRFCTVCVEGTVNARTVHQIC